ncbi:hypothetical protein L3Q82_014738, partial [Scortum barcoo]
HETESTTHTSGSGSAAHPGWHINAMRAVARRFAVSVSVVSRAWRRYQETGQYIRRRGGGRRRATTQQQDRYLRLCARMEQEEHCQSPCKMTSSRPQMCMCLLKRSETDSMRVVPRDEILRPLVRPYAGAVGPGFLLMQDNARPHVAGVCQQFLQDEGIDAMDWPARSPDLNPT